MGDSPAIRDRASWQWEPRLSQMLVRSRGANVRNSERWLEGHLKGVEARAENGCHCNDVLFCFGM